MASTSTTASPRATRASGAATQSADDSGNAGATGSPTAGGDPGDTGLTEVRVLLAYDDHLPNDLATIPASALRGAIAAGYVDPDPAAVAFAKSLTA
jgi:hypothetical protein